jgi:hypothetical protein
VHPLALKLILTPALIGAASLASRQWGPAVGGWLVGLPITSAPVAFFLALEHGAPFAARAAAGTMAGTISQAAFSVAYGRLARRGGWGVALAGGCLAFAAATVALAAVAVPLVPLFLGVVGALAVGLWAMPRDVAAAPAARRLPAWDIPARMAVATALVLLLTGLAPVLGARLTGLLTPFPLYAGTLAVFAHRLEGPGSAGRVLSGLLVGLLAFATFFLVLAGTLERVGLAASFGAAVVAGLAVHGASLRLLSRLVPAGR